MSQSTHRCCPCCFIFLLKGHLVIRSFCNLSLACSLLVSLGTDLWVLFCLCLDSIVPWVRQACLILQRWFTVFSLFNLLGVNSSEKVIKEIPLASMKDNTSSTHPSATNKHISSIIVIHHNHNWTFLLCLHTSIYWIAATWLADQIFALRSRCNKWALRVY